MYRSFAYVVGAYVVAAVSLIGCVEQQNDMPSEEDIKAAHEHVLTQPPATIQHPNDANLEDKLEYLGVDVDTDTVTPGKAFTLTHYWKVLNPVGDDWKIFVHLETPDSKKNHLNADHVPIGGKYPVSLWKKGEIIRDIHRVSVPQSWPGNEVDIYVGAWKGPLRLKVLKGSQHDTENRVLAVKLPVSSGAGPAEKKRIVAKKVKDGVIKLDGKLTEKEWADAPSTGDFVRTMDGQPAEQKTQAKLLWDDKNLYVAFINDDKDIWTTLDKHDDKLWTQEADEMFIDADGDGKTYVELQVNAKGATFDSYLPTYRQNQNDWDANMKAGVNIEGTLNKRDDEDKRWTVELAIPLEAAKGKEKEMKNVPPKVGTEWRVNFFRMDQPNGRPQSGTGWSPPMVGDFHALDKFGVLVFGDDKGHAPNAAATPSGTTPGPKKAEATPSGATVAPSGAKAVKKEEHKNPAKTASKQAFHPSSQEAQ
jgi:hypothetical protein